MRALISALATTLALMTPSLGAAQFAPAIIVNDAVVTDYEITQREAMLRVFRTPGNLADVAREQLIEDRLKLEALNSAGLPHRSRSIRRVG